MTSHIQRAERLAADVALASEAAHARVNLVVTDTAHDCALIDIDLGGESGFMVEVKARVENVRVLDPSDLEMSEADLADYVVARASGQRDLRHMP